MSKTNDTDTELPTSEWSYFFDVDEVEETKYPLNLSPNAEERKNLAGRLGLQKIDELKVQVTMKRTKGNLMVHVQGKLEAGVTQSCVVTGDPVEAHVKDEFEAWYADPESAISFNKARKEREMKKGQAEQQIMEESEDPEPIVEGKIDLGDLATQYLSLALDPYPHAPGAEYEFGDDQEQAGKRSRMDNPFAGLKEWKAKLTKGDS